ncbi:protein I'm not dead yet 2 [Drosophila mauritiana]|uniref:Protein I'm not dead yet 2 n=1 Tax=Drosophila mauritiana TaxID=7226 RepID=A0A6P8K5Z1_DROMA|nr:protein I'm not dead yet 2 [Drosophila mauritiana]
MADPGEQRKFVLGRCCIFHWRGKASIIIPLITLPILIHGLQNDMAEFKCMWLIVTMALLWITETLPIYVTALFPLVFCPLLGLVNASIVCKQYFTDTIVVFLGGLIVALGIEYSNLHTRIALRVIRIVGGSPRRLFIGMMSVSTFMGLWISNSAGTAMMCPIVKALVNELDANKIFPVYMTQEEEPVEEGDPPHPSKITVAFYAGIAYAASIGGLGTLIGTGTNLVFRGIYSERFPTSTVEITFANFMFYSIPLMVFVNITLVIIGFLITHMGLFRPNSKTGKIISEANTNRKLMEDVLRQRHIDLGPMSCHEIQMAIAFAFMIVLLITRKPGFFTGWSDLIDGKVVGSSSGLSFIVLVIFALPTQYTFFKYCCGKGPFTAQAIDAILSWEYVLRNIPWGLLFLLGGGFALAVASRESGLNVMISKAMQVLIGLPNIVVQSITFISANLLSAFNANVVVANIVLPILCEMSLALELHPLILTLPACLGISMVYFLPVSTPPNAIVTQYAHIKTKYFACCGILPTIIGISVALVNTNTWGLIIFPETKSFPDWAMKIKNETKI